MKIYVASSWRNEFQPMVVEVLRAMGHEVYDFRNPAEGNEGFAWSDIDENWENWSAEEYVKAMSHPIAEDGFEDEVDQAFLAWPAEVSCVAENEFNTWRKSFRMSSPLYDAE